MSDEWGDTGAAEPHDFGNDDQNPQEDPFATTKDDPWGEVPETDSGNGWGASGSGFGGDNRNCRNCNQPGHFARDCTQPRSGGGDRGCFNCKKTGHISRDCPEPRQERGGDRACYNCKQTGHMSRDCPEERQERGYRGDRDGGYGGSSHGGGDRTCYNCNQTGHMSRDCREARRERREGGGDRACFRCKETGHLSRDCPNAEGGEAPTDVDARVKAPHYVPPEMKDEELFETINSGINFERMEKCPAVMTGEDKPEPIMNFNDVIVDEELQDKIIRSKYERLTPVQRFAIPAVLAGRDLMACAQTGSGKTAAFNLPIIQQLIQSKEDPLYGNPEQQPICVCVAPTRELAIQIAKDAKKWAQGTDVKVNLVYGGAAISHQRAQMSAGTHMLIGTPGRLLHFLSEGWITLERMRYLVLDEADRMIDDGFIPEIRRLLSHPSSKTIPRQTLMFSATFPDRVQRLAAEFLQPNYLFLVVGVMGSANEDVKQEIFQVEKRDKRFKLSEMMEEIYKIDQQRTIVFVETRLTADFLASYLSIKHFKTTSIHGDRYQSQREEALSDFRSGRFPVLVATSVAARGLDIKGVSHVINYDLPRDIDEYVHRIGRTGRVGHLGSATSFYTSESDQHLSASLVKVLEDSNQEVPEWLRKESTGEVVHEFGGADIRNDEYVDLDQEKNNNIDEFKGNDDDDW